MPIHAATNVIVDRLLIWPIILNKPNLGADIDGTQPLSSIADSGNIHMFPEQENPRGSPYPRFWRGHRQELKCT